MSLRPLGLRVRLIDGQGLCDGQDLGKGQWPSKGQGQPRCYAREETTLMKKRAKAVERVLTPL